MIQDKLSKILPNWKKWAKELEGLTFTIYYAAKDSRTPWMVKWLALLVAAYALSPIDLIPDFIPVLGYLDDLLLIPAGIALVIKLIPADVLKDAKDKAAEHLTGDKSDLSMISFVITIIWITVIVLIVCLLVYSGFNRFSNKID